MHIALIIAGSEVQMLQIDEDLEAGDGMLTKPLLH
eukprot:XP_001704690.1 Hypothetical protein GL50803_11130 [Giardia lamblia ATCC 50803]